MRCGVFISIPYLNQPTSDQSLPVSKTQTKVLLFQAKKQLLIQRRGATMALNTIARDFAASLPHQGAPLWGAMLDTLNPEKFGTLV